MAKRRRKKVRTLNQKFTKRMQKKLVLLFMAIVLAFVVLMVRITYINAKDGEQYTKTVLDQQQYISRTIPFRRGDIVDSNGTKLATSERVYNVILDAKILLDNENKAMKQKGLSESKKERLLLKAEKQKNETKRVLEEHFQIEPEKVDELLKDRPDSRYIILKKGVDYHTAKEYNKAVKDNPDVQGIWLEEDYVRTYPYNSLASDVLGFCVDGNVGNSGLEASYNKILNGTDGREYGYQNAEATIERTVKEPINGNTIVTTIDTNVQSIVEKHLSAFNEAHRNKTTKGEGFKNGSVIIMNPNNGEIIAMATLPSYDLNNPRDLSAFFPEQELAAMDNETKIKNLNSLWRNFAVSDTFEPGSTVKPFTIAAGLESGHLTGDETYYCNGYLHVDDYDVKCIAYKDGGHKAQTLSQVLENSCNVGLMQIALDMGPEVFSKYQHIFGFGEYTGIDLPGDTSAASLLHKPDNMKNIDLATNSFGQNFNVSMIQMAAGFSSIVNGGNYYEPHTVKAVQDEYGNVIKSMEPVLKKKTISKETSDLVKSFMFNVVDIGSGQKAKVEGYDVGGKTGTAEKLPRGENKNLLSFIGYAPQKNPEVVVYVVIDEPNVPNQALVGGEVHKLAADIMAEAFPYMNITKAPQE